MERVVAWFGLFDHQPKQKNDNRTTMANPASEPTLVIAADNSVTAWNCLSESKPLVFYPNEDIPISDVAWNHNGQGTFVVQYKLPFVH